MTRLQFRGQLAALVSGCDKRRRPSMAKTLRNLLREFDAGLVETATHPDTARADAVEQLLLRVLHFPWRNPVAGGIEGLCGEITGLREWYVANRERVDVTIKRANFEAQRSALCEQLARAEAELVELTKEKIAIESRRGQTAAGTQ